MKRKSVIFLLLFVFLFVMAGVPSIPFYENRYGVTTDDSASTNDAVSSHDISKASSIIDSLRNDTVELDSLHLAILRHNKAVDDSLTQDSLNKTKKNGIDSPVEFSANDSLVFIASTGMANLYGDSHVKYQNMDLKKKPSGSFN